jgi:hypothetical protein
MTDFLAWSNYYSKLATLFLKACNTFLALSNDYSNLATLLDGEKWTCFSALGQTCLSVAFLHFPQCDARKTAFQDSEAYFSMPEGKFVNFGV